MTQGGNGGRTPATSARATAVAVVGRVLAGAFLAPTLRAALDRSALAPVDRSFVTDLAYGTVRRLAWLDAALAPRLRAPDRLPDTVRTALRLAAYDLLVRRAPPHAGVHAWVDVVKALEPRYTGLTNAVLRRIGPPSRPSRAARLGLPEWLLARFEAALGPDDAERAAAAMLEPGPLWLTSYRDDAAERLVAEGCSVDGGPLPGTLRVRAPVPLDRLETYRSGAVQPQNPASCVPARVLDPSPGERVLDLAAGHGIKTAQLAASGAAVTAVDVDASKARARTANLRRLGLEADQHVADLTQPVPLAPAPAVLLDAPCTGTGTLRPHPEIKLRLRPADVAAAAERQAAMLRTAATLTERGGRLVYAVCSLTDREGEGQIAAFLERHSDFAPEPFTTPLPHRTTENGAYLLPLDGLDGFYIARLRRS